MILFSLLTLSFIEVAHGIYYNIKIVANHKDIERVQARVADYKSFFEMLNDLQKKYPAHEIIVSSSDQVFLYTASQMGYKVVFDYTNLNSTTIVV